MPQVSYATTSNQRPPHIKHHFHNEDFSRSDYVNYEQIKEKMRKGGGVPYEPLKGPWAFDDDIPGHHRYQPKEYKPDPFYRHRAWWQEPMIRPWEHEDLLVHSRPTRGPGINPKVVACSESAPFSTYHDPLIEAKTDGCVIPTWEKDDHQHIHQCKYELMGKVLGKKVGRKPSDESMDLGPDIDHRSNPKEPRLTQIIYPDNKWNEAPWNRKPGFTKFRPMSPPPPKPPMIKETPAFNAPFSTRDNMVVVKWGEARQQSAWNNHHRRRQRDPQTIYVETRWPFERHEDDPHGKLPRVFKSFPRDPKTYEWQPFPHADEPKREGQQHCDMKEGHGIRHQFYPGSPAYKAAAGDFGRVKYPLKLVSYPRDPATYNPFPFPYAHEPEENNKGHCGMTQGHDRGHQFYPGDPSGMPAAGERVPSKVYPKTWDANAPYMYESYVPFH